MVLGFKTVATVGSGLFAGVAGAYTFAPKVMAKVFGVPNTDVFRFGCRRLSVLLTGMSALSFLARKEPASELRNSVAKSTSAAVGIMAVAGSAEVLRGFAGPGMWAIVAFEVLISAAYASTCEKIKAAAA